MKRDIYTLRETLDGLEAGTWIILSLQKELKRDLVKDPKRDLVRDLQEGPETERKLQKGFFQWDFNWSRLRLDIHRISQISRLLIRFMIMATLLDQYNGHLRIIDIKDWIWCMEIHVFFYIGWEVAVRTQESGGSTVGTRFCIVFHCRVNRFVPWDLKVNFLGLSKWVGGGRLSNGRW